MWAPEHIKILKKYGPVICPFVGSGGECNFKREEFDRMGGEHIFWPATADTGRGMFDDQSMCVPYDQIGGDYQSVRDSKVIFSTELEVAGVRISNYDGNPLGLVEILRQLNMIQNCLAFRYTTHLPGYLPRIDAE